MARLETWYKQDLKRPLVVHKHTDVFNQDSKGNLIGVEVYSDGEPVVLSGSISGYCLLADGTTVPAVGASRSGNKASVLIPQTAYSVPGPITITIKNVEEDNITTLCATVGVVRQSVSGNLVNPGSVVTDWSNDINAQLQAVQTAADNVGAIVAAPFDENTVYVAGNYVTNNGNLYRITADHAAGVAWSGTAKVQCTVGHELEALNKHFIANWNLIDPDEASGEKTGFIPVELNVRYNIIHAQSKGQFQYGLSLYDSNKTMLYISQLVDEATDGTNYSYSCTFTQSAIAYVKIKINSAPSGIDTTDFSKVYFGKGSEYIDFADYNVINAIKKVKDDVSDLADEISDLNSALGTVPSGKTAQGQITDNANDIFELKSVTSYNEYCDRLGLIPYACNGSNTHSLTVVQNNNDVTINGTSSATTNQIGTKILLCDHIYSWNSAVTPSKEQVYPIPLLAGHTYMLKGIIISGTRNANEGTGRLAIMLFNTSDGARPLCVGTIDIDASYVETTYEAIDDINVAVLARVARLMSCDNLVVRIELLDITSEVAFSGKQDTLTFDSAPTENSTNPVTSGGVYLAINNNKDLITYDGFESGTINNSTGKNSSNGNVIRTGYMVANAVYRCSIDNQIRMRAHYYDEFLNYLGPGGLNDTGILDYQYIADEIASDASKGDAKYVRIIFGRDSTPVTLDTKDELHVNIFLLKNVINDRELFNISGTYTNDFSFIVPYGISQFKNMIIECISTFIGEQPTIQFTADWLDSSGAYNDFYKSSVYPIGISGNVYRNTWRVPARQLTERDYCTVNVIIPSGSTLTIKSLRNYYDDAVIRNDCGVTLYAHSMSGCCAPNNTLAQIEMAAKLGYKYVIVVPKATSDGKYVCLHDDGNIQSTARNDDGTAIAEEYRNKPVSDFTLAQLLQFDFGIYRGQAWKGERIPLLEDVFAICAKTGIHPVLSVHPELDGHWENIKALAKKYGVLDKLGIKAPISNLATPMMVLLDDVESYCIDGTQSIPASYAVSTFDGWKQIYGLNKCMCEIEYALSLLTDAYISTILSAGYKCGCHSYGNDAAIVKALAAKGVTEFTEDYNCSVGLNW